MAKKSKSDFMSNKMDSELEQMEKDLSALYSNAKKEVESEFAKFTDTFKKQDAAKRQELESGNITDAEYSLWRQKQILQTDRYKATIDKITDTMVKSDKAAMAVINGKLPSVVAQSYNFTQALGWASAKKSGLSMGTFQVYNARSVQSLMKGKKIMKDVDVPEDTKWNRDKINKAITTSIIKGDSIEKTAESLQHVTNMDKNAAIRNARTCMTAAENMGRTEAADELKAKGIPIEEVWSCVHDSRTRETHILLDGTKRDENGYFGEGILLTPLRFPADPDGDPEEIYNCRCRAGIELEGIDHSNDDELYAQFMRENDPDSWEAIQDRDADKEAAFQARKEAAEARLAEKQAEQAKEKESDTQYPTMPDSVRDAYTKFEDKYIDAKIEHGILFDKDGELLSESQSKRGTSVSIATESMYENHGAGSYEIHNHTADELFSWKDISNYEKYGINGTITMPNGNEYTLYNNNEPRWAWSDEKRSEKEWLATAWHNAQDDISNKWTMDRRAEITRLQDSGTDRDTQRKLLRQWEDNHPRLQEQEKWLQEHAEEYGFKFEKRKVK